MSDFHHAYVNKIAPEGSRPPCAAAMRRRANSALAHAEASAITTYQDAVARASKERADAKRSMTFRPSCTDAEARAFLNSMHAVDTRYALRLREAMARLIDARRAAHKAHAQAMETWAAQPASAPVVQKPFHGVGVAILKRQGMFFSAGRLAHAFGEVRNYGEHPEQTGRDLYALNPDEAAEEFRAGWDSGERAAARVREAQS